MVDGFDTREKANTTDSNSNSNSGSGSNSGSNSGDQKRMNNYIRCLSGGADLSSLFMSPATTTTTTTTTTAPLLFSVLKIAHNFHNDLKRESQRERQMETKTTPSCFLSPQLITLLPTLLQVLFTILKSDMDTDDYPDGISDESIVVYIIMIYDTLLSHIDTTTITTISTISDDRSSSSCNGIDHMLLLECMYTGLSVLLSTGVKINVPIVSSEENTSSYQRIIHEMTRVLHSTTAFYMQDLEMSSTHNSNYEDGDRCILRHICKNWSCIWQLLEHEHVSSLPQTVLSHNPLSNQSFYVPSLDFIRYILGSHDNHILREILREGRASFIVGLLKQYYHNQSVTNDNHQIEIVSYLFYESVIIWLEKLKCKESDEVSNRAVVMAAGLVVIPSLPTTATAATATAATAISFPGSKYITDACDMIALTITRECQTDLEAYTYEFNLDTENVYGSSSSGYTPYASLPKIISTLREVALLNTSWMNVIFNIIVRSSVFITTRDESNRLGLDENQDESLKVGLQPMRLPHQSQSKSQSQSQSHDTSSLLIQQKQYKFYISISIIISFFLLKYMYINENHYQEAEEHIKDIDVYQSRRRYTDILLEYIGSLYPYILYDNATTDIM
jgi:hypothetical protein